MWGHVLRPPHSFIFCLLSEGRASQFCFPPYPLLAHKETFADECCIMIMLRKCYFIPSFKIFLKKTQMVGASSQMSLVDQMAQPPHLFLNLYAVLRASLPIAPAVSTFTTSQHRGCDGNCKLFKTPLVLTRNRCNVCVPRTKRHVWGCSAQWVKGPWVGNASVSSQRCRPFNPNAGA